MTATIRVLRTDGIRVEEAGGAITFRGHAAVFNKKTWIGPKSYGFWEQVSPGAFKDTLNADVRFLWNHDANYVLARTRSGTLRLAEDSRGLLTDADLAPTSFGKDLAILLERGDVTQMSFGFVVTEDHWEQQKDGTDLRTIIKCDLFDVSAVAFPEYEDTDAALASADKVASGGRSVIQMRHDLNRKKLDAIAGDMARSRDRHLRFLERQMRQGA